MIEDVLTQRTPRWGLLWYSRESTGAVQVPGAVGWPAIPRENGSGEELPLWRNFLSTTGSVGLLTRKIDPTPGSCAASQHTHKWYNS